MKFFVLSTIREISIVDVFVTIKLGIFDRLLRNVAHITTLVQ